MKFRCYILLSLVSGGFTEIGRIKPLYEVVECLRSTSAKRIMCLSYCKRFSVPMHDSWHQVRILFRNTCLDALFSTCLNSATPL